MTKAQDGCRIIFNTGRHVRL